MSTDASQTTILPAPEPVRYAVIQVQNSNNARRRGLCGWIMGKWGRPEMKNHVSTQIVRSSRPDATELQRGVNREVARYAGGKYPVPFVGLKQQRKIEGLA